MKRFFQFVGVIFAAFALAVIAGAFMPGVESVERVTLVEADIEDVSDHLADLETWPDWLAHIAADAETAFDGTYGEGASLVWQSNTGSGSVDLAQVSDALVRASVQTEGTERQLTIALAQDESGTTVLMKQDRDLGGFPYLARLRSKLRQGGEAQQLDESLNALKAEFAP